MHWITVMPLVIEIITTLFLMPWNWGYSSYQDIYFIEPWRIFLWHGGPGDNNPKFKFITVKFV